MGSIELVFYGPLEVRSGSRTDTRANLATIAGVEGRVTNEATASGAV